jgi:hypothetical protein
VLGYLDDVAHQALAETLATAGFGSYSLQEKLQRLTDAVLERLLADREFVAQVRTLARRSPLSMLAEPLTARQSLREAVASFLEAAEASGEIEPCDFKGLAGGHYTDYLAGVVTYWLADTSDEFADTTQLVDLSLGVLVQALRGGLVNRVLQLGGFVLRSQLARMVQHHSSLMGVLQLAKQAMADLPSASAYNHTASAPRPAPRRASRALPARHRQPPPVPSAPPSPPPTHAQGNPHDPRIHRARNTSARRYRHPCHPARCRFL